MSDVIIIGGGPAGSALGCYLSKAGISNMIVERAIHPRDHVGESLVTNTTRIFHELGFLEKMESEGFIRKYGAVWHAPLNQGKLGIVFSEFPLEGVDQPYSYHVDRKRFDLQLLKHADELGSDVVQGVTATRVLFDDARQVRGVRVRIGKQEVDLPCKIVVDASGRDTFLGRNLKLKVKDPIFNQYAIHAWYEDVDRGDKETADDIHIYFLPIKRGWVWQIPISDELTSIGVVVEAESVREAKGDLEEFFNAQLQTNHNLAQAMRDAQRVTEFKTEGDYSYSMDRFVGDGFLLIGDAARFVDPIFSSGISVALHSAKFASARIVRAIETNNFSEEVFKPYEEKLREGVEIWYEFIRLYYKLLPLFTYFIQVPQYRLQIFRLLQGEVFERTEVPVLEAMRQYIQAVEATDGHILKDKLTDVPIGKIPDELLAMVQKQGA